MTSEDVQFWTLVVTALASTSGLIMSAWQQRAATNARSLDLLERFNDKSTALQAAWQAASVSGLPASIADARTDLFNHLEIASAGVRRRLVPGVTRSFFVDAVVGTIAVFEMRDQVSDAFAEMTARTTWENLGWFSNAYRSKIIEVKDILSASQSSSV